MHYLTSGQRQRSYATMGTGLSQKNEPTEQKQSGRVSIQSLERLTATQCSNLHRRSRYRRSHDITLRRSEYTDVSP